MFVCQYARLRSLTGLTEANAKQCETAKSGEAREAWSDSIHACRGVGVTCRIDILGRERALSNSDDRNEPPSDGISGELEKEVESGLAAGDSSVSADVECSSCGEPVDERQQRLPQRFWASFNQHAPQISVLIALFTVVVAGFGLYQVFQQTAKTQRTVAASLVIDAMEVHINECSALSETFSRFDSRTIKSFAIGALARADFDEFNERVGDFDTLKDKTCKSDTIQQTTSEATTPQTLTTTTAPTTTTTGPSAAGTTTTTQPSTPTTLASSFVAVPNLPTITPEELLGWIFSGGLTYRVMPPPNLPNIQIPDSFIPGS